MKPGSNEKEEGKKRCEKETRREGESNGRKN